MKSIAKKFLSIILLVSFLLTAMPSIVYADGRASDIYSKSYSRNFPHTKTMVSISPSNAANSVPANIKTVSFVIRLTGAIQYDRLTGRYVSASTPTAEINYTGEVALQFESASTWYRDNGKSVTFYYQGKLKGKVIADTGIICTMDYGNISGNFTVNK